LSAYWLMFSAMFCTLTAIEYFVAYSVLRRELMPVMGLILPAFQPYFCNYFRAPLISLQYSLRRSSPEK
jgi:hypothetical protein